MGVGREEVVVVENRGRGGNRGLGHFIDVIAICAVSSAVADSRPHPTLFHSLPKMATKEDQDTLRLLVQYVSRAFYEPKFTIIMDQLARNPV